MDIQAIQALMAGGAVGGAGAPSQAAAAPGFADMIEHQMARVNTDLTQAESGMQKLAAGEPVALHDVMIALETARIGVQTIIQVRNRLVEAYQDVMRMQI